MLKQIILLTRKIINLPEQWVMAARKEGIQLWKEIPQEDYFLDECLFVTDFSMVGKELLAQHAGVLFWKNEGNKEEDCIGFPYVIEQIEEVEFSYFEKIYRRLQRIPWEIAQTKRCRIREMKEEDLDALYELYQEKEITRYIEDLYEDREQERAYIRGYIEHVYPFWGFGTWIVEHKEEGRLIGRVGFNLREGYEDPELGFVIGIPWQKQGLAYEVCREALRVGREEYGFTKVQALVLPQNDASIKLCEKLGFQQEGEVMEKGKRYRFYQLCLALV